MDLGGRAADLLDRLEATRLASGDLTAFDCYSKDVREAFRNCAATLADALHKAYTGTAANMVLPVSAQQLAGPVAAVKEAASSQRSAQLERLDKALCQLAKTVAGDGAGNSRLEALEALVGQLQAMRLLKHAQAQKQAQKAPAPQPQQDKAPPPKPQPSPEDPQIASAVSDCLRSLGEVLGVPAGGAQSGGGGAAAVASAVAKKVAELVAQLPADFFKPLVGPGTLDAAQVEDLNEVAEALQTEYTVRRRMLLERLKVTLQSFMWSPKLKEMDDGQRQEVENVVSAALSRLQPTPSVQVGDVYSVTGGDVAAVVAQRTVSGSAMGVLNASVKSVMIGKVPDRGGRTEGRAKEAKMPDWMPRSGGSAGGGGRGGGGGNRGGQGQGRGQQNQQGGGKGTTMRPQSAPQHAPVFVPGAGPGVGGQSLAMGYGAPQYYQANNYFAHPQYVAQQQQQQQLMAQHAAMAAMGYVPQGTVCPQSAGGGGRGGGRVQGSWQGQGGRGSGGNRGGGRGGGWGGAKRGRS